MGHPSRLFGLAVAALLVAGFPLVAGSPAQAEESIASYQVKAVVAPDTTMTVIERIDYDFDGESRHGIYREIPVEDELPDGSRWAYDVQVKSVTMDGGPVPWAGDEQAPFLTVKVGDPDSTVTGRHVYVITYTVAGALKETTGADGASASRSASAGGGSSSTSPVRPGDVELYWDFIGTQWELARDKARVEVTGPAEPVAARCYTGASGSTQVCPVTSDGPTSTFGPVALAPGEGLTADLAYPASAFSAIPAPTILPPDGSTDVGSVLRWSLPLAALALIVPPVVAAITRRRSQGVSIPLAPVRFEPPDHLRPAQIQAGLEGDQDSRSVMATLLDFVARKHITLANQDGGFLSRDELHLAWWGAGKEDLQPWETELLSTIFRGQSQATLGSYDKDFAAAVSRMQATLYGEAVASGRMNPKGWAARRTVGCSAGVVVLLIVATFFGSMSLGNVRLFAAVVPVLIGLLIGLVIARWLIPERQTLSSAKFEAEVAGFRKFLDTDPGAARRDLVQRLGLPDYAVFATMLPYAVLFDLENSWSGAFPDLTPEQLRSSGLFLANAWAINSLVSHGSSSLASSYTTPSRSGGSGFSGGGGSSGGGGGGGGGGSW